MPLREHRPAKVALGLCTLRKSRKCMLQKTAKLSLLRFRVRHSSFSEERKPCVSGSYKSSTFKSMQRFEKTWYQLLEVVGRPWRLVNFALMSWDSTTRSRPKLSWKSVNEGASRDRSWELFQSYKSEACSKNDRFHGYFFFRLQISWF